MSQLTPQLAAALAGPRVTVTLLVEISVPGHDIRLLFGSGVVVWGAKTFSGQDDVFGVLESIDEIEETGGDDAPTLGFTMFTPNDTAAATLSSPLYQGSPVRVWLAAISRETGLLVPDPAILFAGELDQTTLEAEKGKRTLQVDCVSAFERFFEDDEGARLSDAFHETIWPGETGFTNVTGLSNTVTWGAKNPT